MTQHEWQDSADPVAMLVVLRCRQVDRKYRLYLVACGQLVERLCPHPDSRAAIEATAQFLEGQISQHEFVQFETLAESAVHEVYEASRDDQELAYFAQIVASGHRIQPYPAFLTRQRRFLSIPHLRDIFGNPFRPVAFAPSWQTAAALDLAGTMYESRDFAAMPILADALEEAGCDDANILVHCRGGGPHVRGDWVVDLVLGKS